MGFPSPSTHPSPGMPRSQTPAESPAQSPKPTPTIAFPFGDTVGLCFYQVTGLHRFTCVVACRSLCLRFVVVVHPSTTQDSIAAGWLGPRGEGIAPPG
jgi:hypothetical protein